jgi:hypothetical protein
MSETKDELLKSFHQQFAENQNHHQTVFIQFISAVLIVIVGYALVYTNTTSDAGIFNVTRDKDQHIVSYAIIHLVGSFFMAELTLTLLCILLLNIGYGYRRDQYVCQNIRKHYITPNDEYVKFFGKFDATGKKMFSYLPDFNLIFVIFLIVLHGLLIFSLFYALCHFNNFKLNLCEHWLSHGLLSLSFFLPLGISILTFWKYYKKYSNAVK